MYKRYIVLFLIVIVAVITAFDIYLAFMGGQEETISLFLWYTAQKWPIIPFIFGVLMGHLFWQNYGKEGGNKC